VGSVADAGTAATVDIVDTVASATAAVFTGSFAGAFTAGAAQPAKVAANSIATGHH